VPPLPRGPAQTRRRARIPSDTGTAPDEYRPQEPSQEREGGGAALRGRSSAVEASSSRPVGGGNDLAAAILVELVDTAGLRGVHDFD
jgi:hypothetical protein